MSGKYFQLTNLLLSSPTAFVVFFVTIQSQLIIGSLLKRSTIINLNGSKTEMDYMKEMRLGIRYIVSSFPSHMKISDFNVSCQLSEISTDAFIVPTWACDNIQVNNKYRLPFGYVGNPRSDVSISNNEDLLGHFSCGMPDPFHEMDALCIAMLKFIGATNFKSYFNMITNSSCEKCDHRIAYSKLQSNSDSKYSYGWYIRNYEVIGYTVSLRCGALIFD